ncbi:hypothetical protein EC973_002116 [Apophysomyces ossiformis]|uniref:CID domain-containing protein n=1 Tax=Apophysomyces ossiformis TaxID=679940 RepID=A0A8H7EMS1_9FUNG|nr:hypothetical protein EC973_002116 [Apophysomyces ossiformis]
MSGVPQQQQQPMANIETVRRNYRTALYELTFNSKPIITNLTILAQENQHAANVIVREIEQQIRLNAPGQKLPVLYLIDSICKNVGEVYVNHFARNIVSIFLDAYTRTEPHTRRNFERLLQTWKNGMPNGGPVFARHIIESIERALNYMREQSQSSSTPHQQQRQMGVSPRNQQIHVNPSFVKNQRENRDPRGRPRFAKERTGERQFVNPPISQVSPQIPTPVQTMPISPPASAPIQSSTPAPQVQSPHTTQANILSSLQNVLSIQSTPGQGGTATPDPVSQILGQIQTLLPTLPPAQAVPIQQYMSQILANTPPAASGLPVASSPMLLSSTMANPTLAQPSPPPGTQPVARLAHPAPSMLANASKTTSMPAPTPTPLAAPTPVSAPMYTQAVNTNELLKGLTSLGYLNTVPVSKSPEASPFLLESKDLQISRPGAVEVLYSGLPLQCKQCGFRYPKTDEGQAKMDAHLDSHFRQNRRMKERVKRGLSRSWFVTEEEWISGAGGEVTSQQAPAFLNDQQFQVHANDNPTMEDTEKTEDRTVIMPNEDRKPCPICGERFIDFWNDEEEEWMYKNAVLVENTIYHATCHADAIKSGTLVPGDTIPDTEMIDVNSQSQKRKAEDQIGMDYQAEQKIRRTEEDSK